ncbi:twin-arginine translocase TatA/TatE family subunit [candidate division KSB1 bacterium]|nr:twin-arginine translocase TatA/TatE family subunit [candidate division KSB1 bacterium]
MFGLGVQELMIVFLIIIVLFGAKKLPELAGGLGKGIKEFKKATRAVDDEDEEPKKIDEGEEKEK